MTVTLNDTNPTTESVIDSAVDQIVSSGPWDEHGKKMMRNWQKKVKGLVGEAEEPDEEEIVEPEVEEPEEPEEEPEEEPTDEPVEEPEPEEEPEEEEAETIVVDDDEIITVGDIDKGGYQEIVTDDKNTGVVFLGADAVGINLSGRRYPSSYKWAETHRGWALGKGAATRIERLAAQGFTTVAIVVYPNLYSAMFYNPIFQKALWRESVKKVGAKQARIYRAEAEKEMEKRRIEGKTLKKWSVNKIVAQKSGLVLVRVADKVAEKNAEILRGKVIGVGRFAEKRLGDDRVNPHEVYPAEIIFENWVDLPKKIDFGRFLGELPEDDKRKAADGTAWIMMQTTNMTMHKEESELVDKLIWAGGGDIEQWHEVEEALREGCAARVIKLLDQVTKNELKIVYRTIRQTKSGKKFIRYKKTPVNISGYNRKTGEYYIYLKRKDYPFFGIDKKMAKKKREEAYRVGNVLYTTYGPGPGSAVECPHCGSSRTSKRGSENRCKKCGKTFRKGDDGHHSRKRRHQRQFASEIASPDWKWD